MTENNTLNILKQAILLEKKGKTFYKAAAEKTDDKAVQAFFSDMAREEDRHIDILSTQFKTYQSTGGFSPTAQDEEAFGQVADAVLSEALKSRISASGFEAAAISAAMAMEDRAVRLYAGRAETAEDPEEKKLYAWLSDWEKRHLEALAALDKKLTETVWNDNNFWPF